jgi:hypothetical protein
MVGHKTFANGKRRKSDNKSGMFTLVLVIKTGLQPMDKKKLSCELANMVVVFSSTSHGP